MLPQVRLWAGVRYMDQPDWYRAQRALVTIGEGQWHRLRQVLQNLHADWLSADALLDAEASYDEWSSVLNRVLEADMAVLVLTTRWTTWQGLLHYWWRWHEYETFLVTNDERLWDGDLWKQMGTGMALVGYHRAFTSQAMVDELLQSGMEVYRMGELWHRVREMLHPVVDDAHLVFINWERVGWPWTYGFEWDPVDLNHFFWLAGLSLHARMVAVYIPERLLWEEAQLRKISQALWHWLAAQQARIQEAVDDAWVVPHMVVGQYGLLPVTFFESVRTGRWWAGHARAQVRVNRQDFEQASREGTLPARWLALLQRRRWWANDAT